MELSAPTLTCGMIGCTISARVHLGTATLGAQASRPMPLGFEQMTSVEDPVPEGHMTIANVSTFGTGAIGRISPEDG